MSLESLSYESKREQESKISSAFEVLQDWLKTTRVNIEDCLSYDLPNSCVVGDDVQPPAERQRPPECGAYVCADALKRLGVVEREGFIDREDFTNLYNQMQLKFPLVGGMGPWSILAHLKQYAVQTEVLRVAELDRGDRLYVAKSIIASKKVLTALVRLPRENEKGRSESHWVNVVGYDENDFFIADSNHHLNPDKTELVCDLEVLAGNKAISHTTFLNAWEDSGISGMRNYGIVSSV